MTTLLWRPYIQYHLVGTVRLYRPTESSPTEPTGSHTSSGVNVWATAGSRSALFRSCFAVLLVKSGVSFSRNLELLWVYVNVSNTQTLGGYFLTLESLTATGILFVSCPCSRWLCVRPIRLASLLQIAAGNQLNSKVLPDITCVPTSQVIFGLLVYFFLDALGFSHVRI